jgi:hypothetical protein
MIEIGPNLVKLVDDLAGLAALAMALFFFYRLLR